MQWRVSLMAPLLFASGAVNTSAPAQVAADPLNDYVSMLRQYFGPRKLIPIVFPAGQRVGDVYDVQTMQLLFSREDCFPGLAVQSANVDLPGMDAVHGGNLGLALGVANVGNAAAQAGVQQVLSLGFSQVVVERATLEGFRRTFREVHCKELRDVIRSSNPAAHSRTRDLLIVGEVYSGVRSVNVRLEDHVQAAAGVSNLGNLLTHLGIHANASIAGGHAVQIVGTEREALAVRPAYILAPMNSVTLGGQQTPSATPVFRWIPFDAGLPSQERAFKTLLTSSNKRVSPPAPAAAASSN